MPLFFLSFPFRRVFAGGVQEFKILSEVVCLLLQTARRRSANPALVRGDRTRCVHHRNLSGMGWFSPSSWRRPEREKEERKSGFSGGGSKPTPVQDPRRPARPMPSADNEGRKLHGQANTGRRCSVASMNQHIYRRTMCRAPPPRAASS